MLTPAISFEKIQGEREAEKRLIETIKNKTIENKKHSYCSSNDFATAYKHKSRSGHDAYKSAI